GLRAGLRRPLPRAAVRRVRGTGRPLRLRPAVRRQERSAVNRTSTTLIGAVAALATVTGVAALAGPADEDAGRAAAGRKPVERSTLVCPQPTVSDTAETRYTAFTPKGGQGRGSEAALYPAEKADTGGSG